MTMLDKPLPNSPDAERMIIGAILLDGQVMQTAAESIQPQDFYSPLHRRVFEGMLSLHKENKVIDVITVSEAIKDSSIDGPTLANLAVGLPMFTDITPHLAIVREDSQRRKLVKQCIQTAERALARELSAEEVLIDAQASIGDLYIETALNDRDESFVPLKQVILSETLPNLDKLVKGETPKIKTGFPGIDEAIGGGISPSDVLLIAGLPSSGKSALSLQIAYQCAANGYPAAFLAGEMTNAENVNRILSQLSGIMNVNSLTRISEQERTELTDWATKILDVPLYLDCRITDLATLGTRLRAITRRYGLKVLVLDYVQLFKMEKLDKRQRVERLAEVSQEVKRLANELGLAIVSVAQFNREGAKSGKPSMHDLEGSSQLEKDASIIFIIDRNEVTPELVDLRIVKGRNTGTAKLVGRFYGRCVRFEI